MKKVITVVGNNEVPDGAKYLNTQIEVEYWMPDKGRRLEKITAVYHYFLVTEPTK